MKISGFSYIRNGFKYQYPFLESIQSILPVCNEFVIAVGDSTDGTREAIEGLNNPKIKIIDTIWDEQMREGGKIFAQQANIALNACTGDWLFHIQADELIHEKDLPTIQAVLKKADSNPRVEGLLFDFLNFYGSYDYLNGTRYQHKKEIRIFRNGLDVFSYRDSQGFRRYPNQQAREQDYKGDKLWVLDIGVPVYHYSYVRPPKAMNEKSKFFAQFWFNDAELDKIFAGREEEDYYRIEKIDRFTGTHPALMAEWVKNGNYDFDPTKINTDMPLKKRVAYWLDSVLGWRLGEYRNYKTLREKL
jgi:glycosyltransferase involved in cell wall biosynthesis